jgi:predicted oxidoreductase (fatty acid repression mutant protein)
MRVDNFEVLCMLEKLQIGADLQCLNPVIKRLVGKYDWGASSLDTALKIPEHQT